MDCFGKDKSDRKFLYGASTSAFQIEGAFDRGKNVWDSFCERRNTVFNDCNALVAADHYHRMNEDLDLLKNLGVNSYRFSTAWARVLPDGVGKINESGLDFYERLVDGLLERGISPFLTMYHWDMPEALVERGGYRNPDVAEWFGEYARVLTDRLGDRVKDYITVNEPINAVHSSYRSGAFAPGYRLNDVQTLKCIHNMLLGHANAYEVIMKAGGENLGIAMSTFEQFPTVKTEKGIAAAKNKFFFSPSFSECVATYLDPVYLGCYPEFVLKDYPEFAASISVDDMKRIENTANIICYNNYGGTPLDETGNEVKEIAGEEKTAMGSRVHPEALYWNCRFLQERYKKPVYITENGACYDDAVFDDGRVHDENRVHYINRHLKSMEKAIEDGTDIRGYFVWSLLDNFEWLSGYTKRFGLVYVDFETLERIPKNSYYAFQEYIEKKKQPRK